MSALQTQREPITLEQYENFPEALKITAFRFFSLYIEFCLNYNYFSRFFDRSL